MKARLLIALVITSATAVLVFAAQPPAPPAPAAPRPPLPPLPPAPTSVAQMWNVNWFRSLLNESPAGRTCSLEGLPPDRRAFFQRKLMEYSALPEGEREAQLRATEIRSHLSPLMRVQPSERAALLQRVPEELQGVIQSRLARWDRLPGDVRAAMLEHQFAMDYFANVDGALAGYSEEDLRNVSGWFRTRLEQGLSRWRALPAAEQDRITRQSMAFFELDDREKNIVLGKLPVSEQQQLRTTIAEIDRLPADQRDVCLDALREFTSMSPEERQRFLLAVARWENMSDTEQARWRETSRQLPPLPPLPPGLALPDLAVR